MSFEELVIYLVVSLVCGLIAQALVGRSIGGFIVSTVVGMIGAMLGRALAHALSAPEPFMVSAGGRDVPILWSIIGAALVIVVVSQVQRRASTRLTSR